MSRWAREEIARLDARDDPERIAHLSAEVRYGDPVLTAALYTVAFCRQMAVPSIAAVVHRGGRSPIMRETRKRNDDTMVFFGELLRLGPSSPGGQATIRRLREVHAPFPITNDQNLYTLASLAFEGERIPGGLGADPLSPKEKEAAYHFWSAVGRGMGIAGIPPTPAAFWAWTLAYEREHWSHSKAGETVARAMIDDYAGRWFESPALRRAGRELTLAMMEDELLDALRLKQPRARTRRIASLGAAAYFRGRDLLPDPPDRSWTDYYGTAYGASPHIAEVGPTC